MKYEMIFGDESLFDGAGLFTGIDVVTRNIDDGLYRTSRLSECTPSSLRINPIVAMRRIIKEPKQWTWEDKKAGRLPEVGALLVNIETGDQFSFVGVNAGSNRWACKDACDGLLYFFKSHEMSPIETPEEKAARLREEWCNEAGLVCSLGMTTLTRIYDAMLSGDLPVPVKG